MAHPACGRRATLAALLVACVPCAGAASTGAGRLQLRSGVAAPPARQLDFGLTLSIGLSFTRQVAEWLEAEGSATWSRASASQTVAVPADSTQPVSSRVTWARLDEAVDAKALGAGVRLLVPERLAGPMQPRPYLAAGLDATYARLAWWEAGQRVHASGWGAGWHVGLGGELDLGTAWSLGLGGR